MVLKAIAYHLEKRVKLITLKNEVSFVAIKNGKHSPRGYLYMSSVLKKHNKKIGSKINIVKIFDLISNYFNRPSLNN